MLKIIPKIIRAAYQKAKKSIELSKYDNFSIAEYFRKQGAQIGDDCYIIPRNLGGEPYLVKIGNNVVISEGAVFHTHDGATWIFRSEIPDLRVFGPIIIEDNCIIGVRAQLLPNVTIGKNSIIGAGSVVIADVPPNSIVMGVPARRFGSIDKYREKCIQRWKLQKPPQFQYDLLTHWDALKNPNEILQELRKHLLDVFKDRLK